LEGAAYPKARPAFGLKAGYIASPQTYLPGIRHQEAGQQVETGCFAGAVRADDCGQLARLKLQTDVFKDPEAPKTFPQSLRLEHRGRDSAHE
jgi:hypothetical protein